MRRLPTLFLLILLAACRNAPAPTPALSTQVATLPPPATAETTAVPPPATAPPATASPDTASIPFSGWPAAAKTYDPLSRQPVTSRQQETAVLLETNLPLERDDVALAAAYLSVTAPAAAPPVVTQPLPVGTEQTLFITTYDTNITSEIPFVLLAVSDHAYFWFDQTNLITPQPAVLNDTAVQFDAIYEQVTFFFGSEDNPGIDGDPRIHIVNAAPQSLCGQSSGSCALLGTVSAADLLPTAVFPQSNEREMLVMNRSLFGNDAYFDTLTHEFRHLIEGNYDSNDTDWEVEGSAMLAEDLLGFTQKPISWGNLFLQAPDQQLNTWGEFNTSPYYGQGYLLNRYLYNRLGTDLYRDFATHPLPGFAAVDAIAAAHNLPFTGLDVWRDWLAALAIHTTPGISEQYLLNPALNTVTPQTLDTEPLLAQTVSQYAADYFSLRGRGAVTLEFTGSNHVALLPVLPASGDSMWLANRANFSQMRLTRPFDLTAVSSATLEYALFQDIEYSYDFAYASLSTDGGQTWQPLVGAQMQGTDPGDDSAETALAGRFYTGRQADWVQERIDLTPFVGQSVLIRFEYVTDPILTFGGLALDNIAIPEIDFYDDAESERGWTAEGFVRATGYVPQQWHLQLVTFADETAVVQPIPLSADNTAVVPLTLDSSAGRAPILIVAATAPMTLQPAVYDVAIR